MKGNVGSMTSVHVFLSALQDAPRALASPQETCVVLADLLSLCQKQDEARDELLHANTNTNANASGSASTSALAVLADFAAAACAPATYAGEIVGALVELLATLACDRSHRARVRLAQHASLLAVPVHCLQALAAKKPGKKRLRVMRIALELLTQLNFTDAGRREVHRTHVVAVLLRVLENPQDDAALLVHVAEILMSCLEMRRSNIQSAAGLSAVPIFLRILDAPGDGVELKRQACEALLLIGSDRELVSLIAANNAIHSLALCLRLRSLHRQVEIAALKLLLLLCEESQVFGQVINEDLIPVLFQIVGRSATADVTRVVCRVLEGVAAFAMGCKLDLAAFVSVGLVCRGTVLVHAVATHSTDASLVACVFRFFATILRNATDLPQLMNAETLEGLLALYMVYGGSADSSNADLGNLLATIVSQLSRSLIDTLTIESEAQSLPALFLCLRSHSANSRFASNVYAIVTRHWCSHALTQSAQALSGFIGIAVEILLLQCAEDGAPTQSELIEPYGFLREILLTADGGDVVLACGGLPLARALGHRLPRRSGLVSTREDAEQCSMPTTPSSILRLSAKFQQMGKPDSATLRLHVENLAHEVVALLNRAIAVAVNQSKGGMERIASRGSRISSLSHSSSISSSQSQLHNPNKAHPDNTSDCGDQRALVDEAIGVASERSLNKNRSESQLDGDGVCSDNPNSILQCGNEDEGDNEDEANNDDSDSDGETEIVSDDEKTVNFLKRLDLTGISPSNGLLGINAEESERIEAGDINIRIAPADANITEAPRHYECTTAALQRVDYSKLKDHQYYYVDEHGVQHPRHPSRVTASCESLSSVLGDEASTSVPGSHKSDGFLLLHEPPAQSEPCRPPDAMAMNIFIEQASRRREEFVATDAQVRARLVYENTSMYAEARGSTGNDRFFNRAACATACPYPVPDASKASFDPAGLTFDSWFESGNLERAVQIGEFEYDLVLRRDLNTTGHTQWFYFAVSNIDASAEHRVNASPRCRRYRFNIINLCKPDSLFNQGLRPVVYSVRDASEKSVGWRRAGEDIYYFPNPFSRTASTAPASTEPMESIHRSPSPDNNNPVTESGELSGAGGVQSSGKTSQSTSSAGTFFTLTFTIEFNNTDDTYLIAHSYPFTFTDQQSHIQRILHQHRASRRRAPQVIRHSVLCTTIQGRPCDLLTISDFSVSTQELKSRRAIILTARVHPGEAQASWIMRGVIDFLVGGSEVARVLRRLFVFHVVPMLNPDGVFHGNSRCSLSACDLNRHWHNPSPELHPTIYHMKALIRSELGTRGVVFFCDIHGHSRKKNVFMYGCDTKKRPNPKARVFAKLFSTQPTAKRFISFVDCSFKVSKDKENTARVVLTKELKLSWCFTLEASFGGASFGELQDVHFNTSHLRQVGSGLCETLLQACITDLSLRERVISLVDDYSVSIAACVDSHLCEAGIVSVANSNANFVQTQTPRKEKGGNAVSELGPKAIARKETSSMSRIRRRRTLGVALEEERKATTVTSSGSKTSRRAMPKRVGTTLPRRKSTPANAQAGDREGFGEPLGASEKKDTRGKRRQSSSQAIDAPPATSGTRSTSKPLLDLLGTFEPPDEEDTQLYMLQSLVRAASGGSGSGTNTSTTAGNSNAPCFVRPETPPRAFPPPEPSPACGPSLPHRRMTAAALGSSRNLDDTSSTSSLFRFTPRDAVPVILPPPVSELLLTRSPKPPSKNIRFKGAGRQYAALAPSPKAPRLDDFVRGGSVASAIGYEPDLINASAISLKHRSCSSITSTAATVVTSRDEQPLSFRSTKLPSTSSATFPSSLMARQGLA